MSETELKERLGACAFLEATAAEIYHMLSKAFPEAGALWSRLAFEEENHLAAVKVAETLLRVGKLPDSIVPESMPRIAESLKLAREFRDRVTGGGMTLGEALRSALALEETIAESYFIDVLKNAADSSVLEKLRLILLSEESHADLIRNYIEKGR